MDAIEEAHCTFKSQQSPMRAQGMAHIAEGFLITGAQRGAQGEPPLYELGAVVRMDGTQLLRIMIVLPGKCAQIRRLLLGC